MGEITFRRARRADVPAVLALLRDDALGALRETGNEASYLAAFDAMEAEAANHLIVGVDAAGRVVATYQLTFISGLSLRATRRAQMESLRVAADLRGQRLGERMMADAEQRARAAGCGLLQLTTNAARGDARRFYERLGFTASHIGYKRELNAEEIAP